MRVSGIEVLLVLTTFTLVIYGVCGVSGPHVVFSKLDVNDDGVLQWSEWCDNMLISAELGRGKSDTDMKQLQVVFNRIDTDNDGTITIGEFLVTIPSFSASETVEQVHLALTAVNTEMMVMWVTEGNTTTSQVMVGTSSGVLSQSFYGYTTTYDVGELGGWHKFIHTVKISGLSAGTKYFYKCGDKATGTYSPEYFFTTPPPTTPTVYGLVADMGTYIPMGWAVSNQLYEDNLKYNYSLIIHAGDIAYAGTTSNGELEEIWDTWANLVEPVAATVPYMVAIGNHEEYYNATSFMHRFYMPGYENGGNTNLWYSIDHGNVHWIFFSTQDTYTPGSPQYQWLQKDLIAANSNRNNVAWIVLVTHRPMYCSDTDEEDQHVVGAPIQVALEPLLVKYSVDIYFCGHMHMYERIHPVINGTVIQTGNTYKSPNAPMHLVVGTAGAFTDHKYIDPQPAWSAVRNGEYGYGKLTVYNNSALHFSFLPESSSGSNDEFWLLK